MTAKWLDGRRKGIIGGGVLKAHETTIQHCIKRMRQFFGKVGIQKVNKTLMEIPSVARTLEYGTNIGVTAMLIYA